MKRERVHILATVRKPELTAAATLVFETIRVGFPTAAISVRGNGLKSQAVRELMACCRKVDARFEDGFPTQLDRWLARSLEVSHEPFWICDTDMVFFGSMENVVVPGTAAMVGEFQPTFYEESTRTIHIERLHTALLWFDPARLRDEVRMVESRFPAPAAMDVLRVLVTMAYVPVPGGMLYFDTAAGLYHAIGGTALGENVLERFEHLHCATYIDLIGPKLADAPGLAEMHQRVYANPQEARGLRARQREYYARRAAVSPHLSLTKQ